MVVMSWQEFLLVEYIHMQDEELVEFPRAWLAKNFVSRTI
jgi:hypothetical protein